MIQHKAYSVFCSFRRVLLSALVCSLVPSVFPVSASAEILQQGDYLFGLKGGYGTVAGYYSQDVKRSLSGSCSLIPFVSNLWYADLSAGYTVFDLYGRYASSIRSGGISLGPCLYASFPYAVPYLGISGDLRYLYLSSRAEQGNSSAWKPGLTAQCGAFIPAVDGILFSFGAKYSALSLSNKLFSSLRFEAGVSYNFSLASRSTAVAAESKARESEQDFASFAEGVKAFDSRDIFVAEKYFMKLRSDSAAVSYLERIRALKQSYAEACALRDQGRQIEAMPLFEKLAPSMKEAEQNLSDLRSLFAREIPSLEKEGIAAYERKDYKKCIAVLRRLSFIDPGNKTAKIYLPRAEKRDEAIEKLK